MNLFRSKIKQWTLEEELEHTKEVSDRRRKENMSLHKQNHEMKIQVAYLERKLRDLMEKLDNSTAVGNHLSR